MSEITADTPRKRGRPKGSINLPKPLYEDHRERVCLRCDKPFNSHGDRICPKCHELEEPCRIPYRAPRW